MPWIERVLGATMPTTVGASQDEVLGAIGGLVGREIAIGELLHRLVDRIAERVSADRGTIYLVDRGKGELVSKAAHLPELDEIRLAIGQGVAGHVAQTGEVVNVPKANGELRFFGGVDERTKYRTVSMLAGPIRDRKGAIIGVVQLLNKKSGLFDEEDERVLAELAEQAGLAIEATTLYEELASPRERDADPLPLTGRFNLVVGESEPLFAACRLTAKAAKTEATVLLRGESGTGKELFARAVHVNSARQGGPFVKVDCAALPPTLIENELFGHEKGAFTSAEQRSTGKFELARGGTIFLDELGELPLAVQGKLLRVLQDREFERIGGERPVKADVRVVAATNRDLEAMVAAGTFRADLYYRVKVVEVRLPTLRERGARDISRLARHFVQVAARRHGRSIPVLSPAALAALVGYSWPGNVRELENCLESAVVIMDGDEILPSHLPLSPAAARAEGARVRTLAEVEREHIVAVLEAAGGNKSVAAKWLDIGRNTLQRRLKELGLGG